MLRNDIDDCSFVPFVFWGFREKYENRWNDKLWIWIAERQHLSLPPQQDPFISSHFAHPELRLHKARPLITAVYLLALFVTILQNPKKTFCVTMTTTVGRVIPKHFSAKRKKINVDDTTSSSATVFCMFSSFRYLYNGERDDWQAHCILFSIAKFPKGSNCCEIFGGIKMWYVKRNNCRGR